MVAWNSARTKVQLKLAVQRLRGLQDKKEALAKKSRRDIATLLEKNKIETARIRVESMISEDIHIELLELLELYCELLIARFGILDMNTRDPDPQVAEAVCAIIYAAPRTEVKELQVLREMLMHKYGREFAVAVMENQESIVSERVTKKLQAETPEEKLVNGYLTEIARTYQVKWTPPPPIEEEAQDSDNEDGGGAKASSKELQQNLPHYSELTVKPTVILESKKATDIATAIPSIPPTEDDDPEASTAKKATARTVAPPPVEDEFDALTRRFAALKKS